MTREITPVDFSGATITAADSPYTFEYKFSQPAYLTRLYARAYNGQQFDLRYNWYLQKGANDSRRVNLLSQNISGKDVNDNSVNVPGYWAGNDDVLEEKLEVPAGRGDRLIMEVTNNDPNNNYTTQSVVSLDYGSKIRSAIERIEGVL